MKKNWSEKDIREASQRIEKIDFEQGEQDPNSPILMELWFCHPDNMFLITLDETDQFVTENVNPALLAAFDIKKEDVVGKSIKQTIPPQYLDEVERRYRECLTTGKPVQYEETAGLDPGNPNVWETLLVPTADSEGRICRIYGISRNLTKYNNIKKEILDLKKQFTDTVQTQTQDLLDDNKRLHELATRDDLTGILNRRYFFELAHNELQRAIRYKHCASLIMFDLDNFKSINDKYGHLCGDQVLKTITCSCLELLRNIDIFGRYGGEEFVVLLPETPIEQAVAIAERLRATLDQLSHQAPTCMFRCSASFGVASLNDSRRDLHQLLQQADMAMLNAKRQGRNRVIG